MEEIELTRIKYEVYAELDNAIFLRYSLCPDMTVDDVVSMIQRRMDKAIATIDLLSD